MEGAKEVKELPWGRLSEPRSCHEGGQGSQGAALEEAQGAKELP